jgi:hypothetical protein
MLDLRHRRCWPADPAGAVGRQPVDLEPGEWVDIEIDLESTTWTLEPGHTLRLAIAGTDWPNCWPPPGPVVLDVDATAIELTLPLVELPASAHQFTAGTGPSADEADGVEWRVTHDVLARETRVSTRYGGTYGGSHGAVVTDDYRGELGVSTTDPGRAWARGRSSYSIEWPEVSATAEATLDIVSDGRAFDVSLGLRVSDGDRTLAARAWRIEVPR